MEITSLSIIKEKVFALLGESSQARKVMLACDEAFSNIVNYSNASKVSFCCEKTPSLFSVIFSDDGIPFDQSAEKVQEKDFDLLDEGGMGLNIIRQTTTEMEYERKDGWNVLTLRFALDNL